MGKQNIIVGLDVGTSKVRVVVASIKRKEDIKPRIIGVGESDSMGMRKGTVVDIDEMTKSIKRAVEQAERSSGVSIEKAYVSIGGSHIRARKSKGTVAVSRADEEVSEDDIKRAIDNASAISLDRNREVMNVMYREFTIDDQQGIQDPRGMNGVKLEVDTILVEGLSPHIKNLRKCLSNAGIEIESLVLDVLAASQSVITRRQKELGVLVLDLGGGTAGMVVYEERKLLHIHILPVGSSHITNDIAIGLKSSIDVAEKVKLEYGSCLPDEMKKKDTIDLSEIDEKEEGVVSRKEIAQIIEARMEEIFSMINDELKKIDRQKLLPSGVILVGGGSKIPGIIDMAKEKLNLPAQIGYPQELEGLSDKVDDPAYATAVGLIFWAMDLEDGKEEGKLFPGKMSSRNGTVNKIKDWFRSMIP
ncbi:MAG: cell division protein FtsA [Candidatus Portnoybacteria bacterium]|nr:cell division protein FtsA [Candidatus Portnoybacteria bacterium]